MVEGFIFLKILVKTIYMPESIDIFRVFLEI